MTVEVFSYRARGVDGKTSTGLLKAESEAEVLRRFQRVSEGHSETL